MDVTIEVDEVGVVRSSRWVNLPVELSPRLHRELTEWCRRTADELQVSGLARADVIEALLHYLVEDETASKAVRARLEAGLPSARLHHPPSPRRPADD
jgi:hypothetical protein